MCDTCNREEIMIMRPVAVAGYYDTHTRFVAGLAFVELSLLFNTVQ